MKYIANLQNANYRNIMITGDNIFTAARAGQQLNFGPTSYLFLKSSDKALAFEDYDDRKVSDLKVENLKDLSDKNTLCIEGPAYKYCEDNLPKKDFETLTKYITIFARVSPYQKELIIEQIKNTGVSVLMCGDGTNDVGGLKKADVGIALVGLKNEPTKAEKKAEVERVQKVRQDAMKNKRFPTADELMGNQDVEFKSGDACIAAPFTNKQTNSLKCVQTVIRQGICTLSVTIQTYRILTLQSLIIAWTMSTLHLENLKTSDMQNTVLGIFGAYYFFSLSSSKPVRKLPQQKPEGSIFNIIFWMSIIGQAIILLAGNHYALHFSRQWSSAEDLEVTNEEEYIPTFRNSMMWLYELNAMFCISIFNHEGEPFMESLTSKAGQLKFILAPLAIIFCLALDCSDDLNHLFNINLESTNPNAHYLFFLMFCGMTLSCWGWTRLMKYLRFKTTYGYL